MTDKDARKRAIADYKLRKSRAGIFVVRCTATGRAWVGRTPTLDAAQNRLWFTLRTGGSYDTELLAEWRTHGEAAFSFAILEVLDEELAPMLVADTLKAKQREWADREKATMLLR